MSASKANLTGAKPKVPIMATPQEVATQEESSIQAKDPTQDNQGAAAAATNPQGGAGPQHQMPDKPEEKWKLIIYSADDCKMMINFFEKMKKVKKFTTENNITRDRKDENIQRIKSEKQHKEFIESIKMENFTDYAGVVLCIEGHGCSGDKIVLEKVDAQGLQDPPRETINSISFVNALSENKSLKGKMKFIFLDCCRGDKIRIHEPTDEMSNCQQPDCKSEDCGCPRFAGPTDSIKCDEEDRDELNIDEQEKKYIFMAFSTQEGFRAHSQSNFFNTLANKLQSEKLDKSEVELWFEKFSDEIKKKYFSVQATVKTSSTKGKKLSIEIKEITGCQIPSIRKLEEITGPNSSDKLEDNEAENEITEARTPKKAKKSMPQEEESLQGKKKEN